MPSHTELWIWYILGAFLTLLFKYASYVYHGAKMQHDIWISTKEWVLERTIENAASWVASLGNFAIAWTFGKAYISRWTLWGFLGSLPLDIAISFTLGVAIEIEAPNIMKWLVKQLPGGNQT